MAYPEPNNLDDIYGPGAEDASIPDDHADCLFEPCPECGRAWPAPELEDGFCPDCRLFHRDQERSYLDYIEARERRDEYNRIVDGQYEVSDADPGL